MISLEPVPGFQAPIRFGAWPTRRSPRDALTRYRGPVPNIGGARDRSTPPVENREMLAAAPGRKSLWLVSTGDHAAIRDLADPVCRRSIVAFPAEPFGVPD